jgi:serine/threonine protein kinase
MLCNASLLLLLLLQVLKNSAFDGFAVDVWACGIILFIMLTGIPPFEMAHERDARFQMIAVDHVSSYLTATLLLSHTCMQCNVLQCSVVLYSVVYWRFSFLRVCFCQC